MLDGGLVLDYCTVGTHANLSNARLFSLSARRCSIGADLVLQATQVDQGSHGAIGLSGIRCEGSLVLHRLRCAGMVDFSHAVLGGIAAREMTVTHVGSPAINGRYARVEGQVELSHGKVDGSLQLTRSTIGGSLDLAGSSITGWGEVAVDLSEIQVGGTLYMTENFCVAGGSISLSYADVATLRDDPDQWPQPGDLDLRGLTYRNLVPLHGQSRIQWAKRATAAIGDDHSWQPYEQLMETLRRHGREGDRKAVAIAKQRAIGDAHPRMIRRILSRLYGFVMRYGYQPQRALVFAPLFLSATTFVFLAGANTLMVPSIGAVRVQWEKNRELPRGYPSFNSVAYSFDSFVPILSLNQRDSWRPDDRATCDSGPRNCGALLRIWLWINIGLGWIVTTLAVAGFTGLIRRD